MLFKPSAVIFVLIEKKGGGIIFFVFAGLLLSEPSPISFICNQRHYVQGTVYARLELSLEVVRILKRGREGKGGLLTKLTPSALNSAPHV